MKLEINVPISGLDLANLPEGEQGLFLCQNRGQNYITVVAELEALRCVPQPCCLKEKRERHCHPTAHAPSRASLSSDRSRSLFLDCIKESDRFLVPAR
jgi:hypothetical protein